MKKIFLFLVILLIPVFAFGQNKTKQITESQREIQRKSAAIELGLSRTSLWQEIAQARIEKTRQAIIEDLKLPKDASWEEINFILESNKTLYIPIGMKESSRQKVAENLQLPSDITWEKMYFLVRANFYCSYRKELVLTKKPIIKNSKRKTKKN